MRKNVFRASVGCISLLFATAALAADNDEKLRKLEERMIPTLRSIHGEDLGFRNLIEGYSKEEAEYKSIVFDSIWVYTEEKIKKMGEPVPAEMKKLIGKFRADSGEYERLRYPKEKEAGF